MSSRRRFGLHGPPASSGRGASSIVSKAGLVALRLTPLLLVVAVWEFMGRTRGSSLTLPPATEVATALGTLVRDVELWQAVGITLQSFVIGFGLALIIGLAAGMASARYRPFDRMGAIYLRILMTAPLAPLVPLMVGVFGIGIASRIALVFLFSVAVIAINTQAGIRHVDRTLVEMANSFGANERTTFRKVRFPGAVPAIMAGVRLGAARGVVGMVVAELIIVSVGLGRLLNFYRGFFQAAEMFAVVIVILSLGVAILLIVKWIERRLTVWKR